MRFVEIYRHPSVQAEMGYVNLSGLRLPHFVRVMTMQKELVEALETNSIVFMVGSGTSDPLGLPNWNALVDELLDSIDLIELGVRKAWKVLLETGTMSAMRVLDAMLEATDGHAKKPISDYIVNRFTLRKEANAQKLDVHYKIWKASRKVITTNYDNALELASPGVAPLFTDFQYQIGQIHEVEEFLLKLHGCVTRPEKFILFTEQYNELYGDPQNSLLVQQIRRLIQDNTIVFVGFSLDDPYVREQFTYIHQLYSGFSRNHFLFTTKVLPYQFKETGVNPILLGSWGDLPDYLDSMAEITKGRVSTVNQGELQTSSIQVPCHPERVKACMLVSSPLNRNIQYQVNFDKLSAPFPIDLDICSLSIESLRNLDGYDYIFIYTKVEKQRIVIEDRYMLGELVYVRDICDDISLENLKGLFLVTDKPITVEPNLGFPIVVVQDGKDVLGKLLFQAFKKADLAGRQYSVINPELLRLDKLLSGGKMKIRGRSIPVEFERSKHQKIVGRKSDIQMLVRRILDLDNQFLNVKGSGGIGKTTIIKRVAVELAKRDYFRDGIWCIDCEFVEDYSILELKVASCFGLEDSIEFLDHICSNEVYLDGLVILDNFESVFNKLPKQRVDKLLSILCQHTTVVVTSRDQFNFESELIEPFRSMTTDEAVELFIDNFRLVNQNEMGILRNDIIERILNNNPLAIKIVTGNTTKSKDIAQLKVDLEQDFFNVTSTEIDVFNAASDRNIERSRSLYHSINYSYQQLSDSVRRVFEMLCLFPNGIHLKDLATTVNHVNGKNVVRLFRTIERDVKVLEEKSLVENVGGYIKLQSILGKFANFKFALRATDERRMFYEFALFYHDVLLESLGKLQAKKKVVWQHLFAASLENFMSSIGYLQETNFHPLEKLRYIDALSEYMNVTEKLSEFIERVKHYGSMFREIENGSLLFQVIFLRSKYYAGHFEDTYAELQRIAPLKFVTSLESNSNWVNQKIITHALEIYVYEGHALENVNYRVTHKDANWVIEDTSVFHLGCYRKFTQVSSVEADKLFWGFEVDYNTGALNLHELDEYIRSLPQAYLLEKMQCMYIKAKLGLLSVDDVKPLLVSNTYSRGIKHLMFALVHEDPDECISYFKRALEDLFHIRYYYVECLYLYARYLKSINEQRLYTETYEQGLSIAQACHYRVLVHRFHCLQNDRETVYDEDKYPLSAELELV